MNDELSKLFNEIEDLRNDYFSTEEFNGTIHRRAIDDKWSIAEVVYHCYLLVKLFRQISAVYIPSARIYMKSTGQKPHTYNGEIENIYAGETMKAPSVLVPKMDRKYTKGELRMLLEQETDKVKRQMERLSTDEIYWIRYPDPVADYPNIFQAVKLALIHEAHHYSILLDRERKNP